MQALIASFEQRLLEQQQTDATSIETQEITAIVVMLKRMSTVVIEAGPSAQTQTAYARLFDRFIDSPEHLTAIIEGLAAGWFWHLHYFYYAEQTKNIHLLKHLHRWNDRLGWLASNRALYAPLMCALLQSYCGNMEPVDWAVDRFLVLLDRENNAALTPTSVNPLRRPFPLLALPQPQEIGSIHRNDSEMLPFFALFENALRAFS